MSDTNETIAAILAEMREWSTDENDALARYADRIERANVRALALLAEERAQLEAKAESEKRWANDYFDLARRREDALVHCRQYAQKIERENDEGETRLDAEEIIATVDNEFAGIRPKSAHGDAAVAQKSAKVEQPGNDAALRSVLMEACDIIRCYDMAEADGSFANQGEEVGDWFAKAEQALSAPARNVDLPECRTRDEAWKVFERESAGMWAADWDAAFTAWLFEPAAKESAT